MKIINVDFKEKKLESTFMDLYPTEEMKELKNHLSAASKIAHKLIKDGKIMLQFNHHSVMAYHIVQRNVENQIKTKINSRQS